MTHVDLPTAPSTTSVAHHHRLINNHTMPVASLMSDPEKTRQQTSIRLRRHDRHETHIRAILHYRETFTTVLIRNLSRGGAGLNCSESLMPEDKVMLTLLDGRSIQGEVRWWLAGACGIKFRDELSREDPLLTRAKTSTSQEAVQLRSQSDETPTVVSTS